MCVTRLIKTLLFAIKKVNVRKIFCFFTTGAVLKENTKEPGGGGGGGTGERGGGSGLEFFFFCDPSLSFYSRCFEAYKHIYPGPSYFLRAKEGLIFFISQNLPALSLSHPTPHPSTIKNRMVAHLLLPNRGYS